MKRYTFQVTKDVEILAENEHDALCGVVLEDYDNETTKRVEFLYASSEDFFADPTVQSPGANQKAEEISMEEIFGKAPDCETEPCDECESYHEGHSDGYTEGYDAGQVDERARIHETVFGSEKI